MCIWRAQDRERSRDRDRTPSCTKPCAVGRRNGPGSICHEGRYLNPSQLMRRRHSNGPRKRKSRSRSRDRKRRERSRSRKRSEERPALQDFRRNGGPMGRVGIWGSPLDMLSFESLASSKESSLFCLVLGLTGYTKNCSHILRQSFTSQDGAVAIDDETTTAVI